MAQHDYVIDNQSFPATRADINSVLQAIVSNNSGSSAPSTTFANQIWYDTSENKLYIRNEDNDAWIPLFLLDQSNDVGQTLVTTVAVEDASGTNTAGTSLTIKGGAGTGTGAGGNIILQTANAGSSGSSSNSHATAVTIDDAGFVGVGVTPVRQFHVHESASNENAYIHITNAATGSTTTDGFSILTSGTSNGRVTFMQRENQAMLFNTNATEKARLLADGKFLVAKSSTDTGTAGVELRENGQIVATLDGGGVAVLNRLSTDGNIIKFLKDGSTDGQINVVSNDIAIGTGSTGLRFGSNSYLPHNMTSNGLRDNAIDIGSGSYRYDDIFATNTTIQTSDQNEKQQIASLTDAEITAAKAISKLFKTFKWNDSVEAKGDNARTHTGHVAQEVQSAMTDAGLDVTKYAFWCSDTWWEHLVDVPAVEAVEAVTGTETDDDGNEVEIILQEAVEAQDAYTRVDAYYTAEDAPEGATQRTRLGIRYPQLLAFIGAATEQRLTSIEARLTALEG